MLRLRFGRPLQFFRRFGCFHLPPNLEPSRLV
jgi:hypothetical protein